MTMVLVLCIGAFSGHVFGQQTDAQKNEKKGGYAVGGYDAAKQSKEVKRSIEIKEDVEAQQKEEVALPPAPAEPAQVPPPPPPVPGDEKTDKVKDKDAQGNAYGKDKEGLEGKEFGQARSLDAKAKQKSKNTPKSKGKQK